MRDNSGTKAVTVTRHTSVTDSDTPLIGVSCVPVSSRQEPLGFCAWCKSAFSPAHKHDLFCNPFCQASAATAALERAEP
jgi:hypothetical protein